MNFINLIGDRFDCEFSDAEEYNDRFINCLKDILESETSEHCKVFEDKFKRGDKPIIKVIVFDSKNTRQKKYRIDMLKTIVADLVGDNTSMSIDFWARLLNSFKLISEATDKTIVLEKGPFKWWLLRRSHLRGKVTFSLSLTDNDFPILLKNKLEENIDEVVIDTKNLFEIYSLGGAFRRSVYAKLKKPEAKEVFDKRFGNDYQGYSSESEDDSDYEFN
jgi:predicted house-cleaning noncanonical NTP pyrophosphatase (MazG superfamily)